MKLERTMAGLEARLASRGAGRFGGAVFLGVWLVFWAAGEVFALWILLAGGWALFTGQPLGSGKEPLALAPALFAGVFLLGWLAIWSVGGLMAGHEFLRLLWSSDRLQARGDGLCVVNRAGPFAKRRFLRRDSLRSFVRLEALAAVQAETAAGVVELTRNGTPAEQAQLVAALTAEFRLPPANRLPPILPEAWREVRAPEGGGVLVKDPAARRKAARGLWLVALPLTWAALTLLREAWIQPDLGAAALMLAAIAGFALWGAVRLTWAREEWRLEPGRLARQSRCGSRRREVFTGTALRLAESTDSDGDRWFALTVRDTGGAAHTLVQRIHDPTEPQQLGRWLAARTALPFEDLTTPEERARAAAEQAAQGRMIREWLGQWLRSLRGYGRQRK